MNRFGPGGNGHGPMNPPAYGIALQRDQASAVPDTRIPRELDGNLFVFGNGEPQSILHLSVPRPTPMLLYVSISPEDNQDYADSTMTGGIYDSSGHACTFLATLKVGGENSLIAYSFDVAMGRLYRIALAAGALTMTGRFVAVPHVTNEREVTSTAFNSPKKLQGFLTPDAPPLESEKEKEKKPLVQHVLPRNSPVRVTTLGILGFAGPNVLPHLTRRLQVTVDAKSTVELPIAWGATHVRILGSTRSRFFYSAIRSHGKAELVGPLQLQAEPFEIAHNAASIVLRNENTKHEDYEVVYYLGF